MCKINVRNFPPVSTVMHNHGGVSYCVLRCELPTSVDFPYLSCCKTAEPRLNTSDVVSVGPAYSVFSAFFKSMIGLKYPQIVCFVPTTNNSDSVALSISSRLHNFTKSDAPWIVTLSSSDFNKNLEFSFILNSTVPSLMLFYSLMQSRVVSKGKICELLGYHRRGPNLQNSFRLTIHYHAVYYWNVSLGLRMCVYRALISKLIWRN